MSELARRTRFPVAFGGLETEGAIHITSICGARTRNLDGLVVQASRGLGGRAFVEKRPRLALDYASSRAITHDYDTVILGEGIATLFAVPIMVAGNARGVLYCGSWGQSPVGDVVARPAIAVADELATELRISDEVERRVNRMPARTDMPPALREELRCSYAELRRVSAGISDAALRAELAKIEQRLAVLSSDHTMPPRPEIRLSPREVDVLACVAVGATNAEIGTRLGLKEATVKSYLQTAMSKLDATTRHSAVAAARRAGVLP
ncbi:LuxR C-terminal-related transcriptional regulator [Microbacterium sp. C7(2022)]|nr:LuxR C-terminal-related transcriptional regulator [Microbacterium sp. C7(2022)]